MLNTKVEFSRGGLREERAFESVDPHLVGRYALTPILANHYTRRAAYRQKVEALITRSVTQARDVFDLYLLLAAGVDSGLEGWKLKGRLGEAVANALSVTFDMFRGQVYSDLSQMPAAVYCVSPARSRIHDTRSADSPFTMSPNRSFSATSSWATPPPRWPHRRKPCWTSST